MAQITREEEESAQEDERQSVLEGQRAALQKQVAQLQQALESDDMANFEAQMVHLKQEQASIRSKLSKLEGAFKLIRKAWEAQGAGEGQDFTVLLQSLMNRHYVAPHSAWIDVKGRRKTHVEYLTRSGLAVRSSTSAGKDLLALNLA